MLNCSKLLGALVFCLGCQMPKTAAQDCECPTTNKASLAFQPTIADYQQILQLVVERPSFSMFDDSRESSEKLHLGLEHLPIESLRLTRKGIAIPLIANFEERAVPPHVNIYNVHIEKNKASLRYSYLGRNQEGRFEFRKSDPGTQNHGSKNQYVWKIRSETIGRYQMDPPCIQSLEHELRIPGLNLDVDVHLDGKRGQQGTK